MNADAHKRLSQCGDKNTKINSTDCQGVFLFFLLHRVLFMLPGEAAATDRKQASKLSGQ